MWLFTFIVGLLPTAFLSVIIDGLLGIGVAATIAAFFIPNVPFITQYKLPLQILGIVLLTLGVYLKGSYETEVAWREKVENLEKKVAASEAKAPIINTIIETKIVKQVERITDVKHVIHDVIVTQEKIINGACELTPEAIQIHNASARNEKPKEIK